MAFSCLRTSVSYKTRISVALGKGKRPRRFLPVLERLEDRTVPSAYWASYGGTPQHTAVSGVASQPLDSIHWTQSVDLTNASFPSHYGSIVITPSNTVIIPVMTDSSGSYELVARNGATGNAVWTNTSDYQNLTSDNNGGWGVPFSPTLTPSNRLYFAGDGGTVYYINDPDTPGATVSGQLAFYGLSTYQANASLFNSTVMIDTPITSDADGNIYFGFTVIGTNSILPEGGIARIDTNGNGTYVLASTAANDSAITQNALSASPALSNDGSTVYVAVNNSNNNYAYLLGLNSTTLATEYSSGVLQDPRGTGDAEVVDQSTASPMVAPDGTVFFGVFGNSSNGSRGFMLHFSADLSTEYTPGAFGWDDTASIVPASMIPAYHGTSSYLVLTKYNNYVGFGQGWGDGVNKIAILDPYASEPDPNNDGDPSLHVMKEVLTMIGPTPDSYYVAEGYPNAVDEWCVNDTVVDPSTDSVILNSEDGHVYRWDLGTDTLSQAITETSGIGEPYTSTEIGPDGTIYATNGGTLFAMGSVPDIAISNVPSFDPVAVNQPVTFTTTVSSTGSGPTPGGSITYLASTVNGGTTLGTVTLTNGQAVLTTSFAAVANEFITASYSVNENIVASTTLVETISPYASVTTATSSSNPSTVGRAVTFTASVKGPSGSPTATGMVAFMDGATRLYSAFLNGGGQATYTTSGLAAGSHAITAVYGGEPNFGGSQSADLDQSVTQQSSTRLTASATRLVFGQSVVFTVTVSSGRGTPTGTATVSFVRREGGLGTVAINSSGQGTITTSTLAPGNYILQAVYSGDANFGPSVSPLVTVTVLKDSTKTTLGSSPNPAQTGQPVTFTATVSPSAPAVATPTGAVAFLDGATTLGTAKLTGGIASFTTSSLSEGVNSITAIYGGSPEFVNSTSEVLKQTVNPVPMRMVSLLTGVPTSAGPGFRSPTAINDLASSPWNSRAVDVLRAPLNDEGWVAFARQGNSGEHRLLVRRSAPRDLEGQLGDLDRFFAIPRGFESTT